MLSTFHNNETVDKERRSKNATGGLEIVKKPKMVEDYNKYMGGVDRNDQMVPYYSYSHKLAITCKLIILIAGQRNGGGDYSSIFFMSPLLTPGYYIKSKQTKRCHYLISKSL